MPPSVEVFVSDYFECRGCSIIPVNPSRSVRIDMISIHAAQNWWAILRWTTCIFIMSIHAVQLGTKYKQHVFTCSAARNDV